MTGVMVVGPPDDAQVRGIVQAVRERDRPVHVHQMRTEDVDAWTWSSRGIVTPGGLCLTDALGIYVRSFPIRMPTHATAWVDPAEEDTWLRSAARYQRAHGFLKSVHMTLSERGRDVINPLWAYAFHRSKPGADLTLSAAGVPVPRGVATNDPVLVRELLEEVEHVVYKPVAGGGRCHRLDPERLDDQSSALAATPCYFQELIPGRNLRIYTLGDEVLAAFVIESADIDYREHEENISVVAPSTDVQATAVLAASALDLTFAGTDIKLLPDGSHVVLDVNPSPMFAALDELVDSRIADALARRLIGSSQ